MDESLKLLGISAEQGMKIVCATPHFYPTHEDPESFLHRREKAWETLSQSLDENSPKIVLGAEVYYFGGIARNEMISDLRIGDTGILLLEMPFNKWTDAMVREIVELNDRKGVRVMLAHIERYIKNQERGVFEYLLDNRVIMQSNADFFVDWMTKHKALRMLKQGRIHVVSSDAHNLDERRPKIGEALAALPADAAQFLRENAYAVFRG